MHREIYEELCVRYHAATLPRSGLVYHGGRNAVEGAHAAVGSDLLVLLRFSDWASLAYYVGGCSATPSGLLVGRAGTVSASSSHRTVRQIHLDRAQHIGTAIPGWDVPGLRWRVSAVAPMSRTVVPFMGRTDQYLVCRDPIPHIVAERHTLAEQQPHPGDLSQYPSLESMADAVRRSSL